MIGSINARLFFQVQATTTRSIVSTKQDGSQGVFLPSDSVSISSAAQSKLASEQQMTNAAQSDTLPIGVKHMLEQIVDDPAFGAKYANGYTDNIHTACMTLPEFMRSQDALETGHNQLQEAWKNIQSEGKSPAQSYAELLKYELSMPKNYWDAQDPGHTMPDIRSFAEAKLNYLEQYIAAST